MLSLKERDRTLAALDSVVSDPCREGIMELSPGRLVGSGERAARRRKAVCASAPPLSGGAVGRGLFRGACSLLLGSTEDTQVWVCCGRQCIPEMAGLRGLGTGGSCPLSVVILVILVFVSSLQQELEGRKIEFVVELARNLRVFDFWRKSVAWTLGKLVRCLTE